MRLAAIADPHYTLLCSLKEKAAFELQHVLSMGNSICVQKY